MRLLLLALLAPALAAQVSNEDLRKGPNQDWLTYIGDYSAHRHSPLTEINPRTISRLAPKWVRNFAGTGDLETVPLVYQGVMYATIPNEVFALDAITGREIWHYRAQDARRAAVNRGVAILGERIYFETADCHLVALRRTSGAVVWDREYRGVKFRLFVHGRTAGGQGQDRGGCGFVRPDLLHRGALRGDRERSVARVDGPAQRRAGFGYLGQFPARERQRSGVDHGHVRSRASICSTGRPEIPGPISAAIGRATISTPTACSRSTPTPAR